MMDMPLFGPVTHQRDGVAMALLISGLRRMATFTGFTTMFWILGWHM